MLMIKTILEKVSLQMVLTPLDNSISEMVSSETNTRIPMASKKERSSASEALLLELKSWLIKMLIESMPPTSHAMLERPSSQLSRSKHTSSKLPAMPVIVPLDTASRDKLTITTSFPVNCLRPTLSCPKELTNQLTHWASMVTCAKSILNKETRPSDVSATVTKVSVSSLSSSTMLPLRWLKTQARESMKKSTMSSERPSPRWSPKLFNSPLTSLSVKWLTFDQV